jgi:hypothetical protein
MGKVNNMSKSNDLTPVFASLVKIMKKYEKQLELTAWDEKNYSLNGPYSEKFKKKLWFGGVQVKKNYVSYHLMPVYMYADLAEEIPANLKKRMQGKSCFNFKKVDDELFSQLAKLTEKSYKTFTKRGDDIKY